MKNLAYFLIFLLFWSCGNNNESEIPLAEVRKGVFYLEIHEEGEIKATTSTNISSPNISWRYGMLKITQMVDDGSEVLAGDTVVVFDPSEVKKVIVDSEASVEMKKAELEKLTAEQESSMEELKADLEVTRLSQQISRIQFESANYEAEIKRKEIQLNLEKANIALERAVEQIDNKKKIQFEELKQKQLEITQTKNQLSDANETLQKLYLVSPTPGIAIINKNWSSGNKFQIGDQTWSGYPLIELPDLSELKAEVQINEVDISKIMKGLRVEIKPDAFSDSIYDAEVIAVANLAVNKDRDSKIKVFPVDILIKTTSENLLPGLTVSCRIIVDQIDDVMYLPIEAVHSTPDNDFVYLQTKTGFIKQEVELGQSNTDFIIIKTGLDVKNNVALINPFIEDEEQTANSNN
ncbi:MAG: HlyD family efflux transporter periplasmic adaptor subunit [Prolixibacteraceae bacterium]|jgi:HlyD family secretion protein|nr:HlyD family efflux transporter periplasmic adaptor subunit [Prolixibacteraceae bacterium]